ncbi:MAG: phenylalanyl-tRNA synthetase beta chain [Hyphomonadaceae bacterium]|nr:MAG: phenylalanyl-tRNA synthetase beta chain [Hyphomonadaceae bacterium]
MKFTINWLKDYLKTDASLAQIVEAMTMAGLEVEEVIDPAAKLGAFSVAKIIKAEQHPNADKLRVCQVETNLGKLEIVCGAPNARAGLTTIFAPLGTCIPSNGMELVAKPVRGVVSNGMMCSYEELCIEGDSSGIIELPNELEIGTPAAEALGLNDAVIDFEVTPNRPDWLGVNSIARELAASSLGEFQDRNIITHKGAFDCPIKVTIEAKDACPQFAGRLVRGVKNGPSPKWLQNRLLAIGLRPINALVDITNFISYDRARPLHVYDAKKLQGNICVRYGKVGETFEGLDGNVHEVSTSMCAITDDSGAIGLGGVLGGASTGCDEATTDVFIECAFFEALGIFQTGRATGIQSDAKYRFERGVDPDFVIGGIEFATQMVLELCGGEASNLEIASAAPSLPQNIIFPITELKRLTGIDLNASQIGEILGKLGFTAKDSGNGNLDIGVPSWRGDCKLAADIVEDIARIYGFDKLPLATLSAPKNRQLISSDKSRFNIARRALASLGYNEAVTWSFVSKEAAVLFGANSQDNSLALANPISDELAIMRPSGLINLISAAGRNINRGLTNVALFEAAPIYLSDEPDGQKTVIAGIVTGSQRHFSGKKEADIYSVQADLMAVLAAMGIPTGGLMMQNGASTHWHPGRAGSLKMGSKILAAEYGQIHPRVCEKLGVKQAVFGFEIFVDNLPQAKQKPTKARAKLELSPFMPLSRDFAFLLPRENAAAELVRVIANVDKNLISNVQVFDNYQGHGVPDSMTSLALEVTIAPKLQTLSDVEIEALSTKIISAATKIGATLRT